MPAAATAALVVVVALLWAASLVMVARAARRQVPRRPAAPDGTTGAPVAVAPPSPGPPSRHGAGAGAGDADAAPARLLDVLEDGTVLVDGDDRVVLANGVAAGLGAVLGDRLAPPLQPVVRAARAARTGEGRADDLPLPRSRFSRDTTPVRVRAVADPDGHVALLLEDRTEARRLESVRQDFVANVGHELKTPVGALRLLAEAIGDSADDEETVRRFAARAEREAERLGRLVTEMVDLSRLQGAEALPEPRAVPLDAVVAEAVDRVATAAAARRIRVAVAGSRGVVVRGDAAHLTTAVANLVDNAVVHSPEDTDVTVAVRRRPDGVEVAVSDQGYGIAAEDRTRVFERFFRADRSRRRPDGAPGGNGLGLAIVKHVAENHGGSVDVWSVEGSGSTFTLRLPPAPGDDAAAPAPTPPARADPSGDRR